MLERHPRGFFQRAAELPVRKVHCRTPDDAGRAYRRRSVLPALVDRPIVNSGQCGYQGVSIRLTIC